MKSLFMPLIIFVIPFCSLSQKIDSAALAKLSPGRRMEVDSMLVQAKTSSNSAVSTLLEGSVISIAGLIILGVQAANDDWFDNEEPNYAAGSVMFFGGGAIALLSIPQFRKSRAIRKEANLIVFGHPATSLAPAIKLPRSAYAGIRISIPLGK
jgi:hypothetical protein